MKNEKKRSVGKNKKKKTNLETGKQSKQEKFKKGEKGNKNGKPGHWQNREKHKELKHMATCKVGHRWSDFCFVTGSTPLR